jgi:uncharacterized membrane protein YccF (DUF307 family)
MRLILNILWFLFGGFISGAAWLIAGCLLAITIVGLPWTPAAFRLAGFSCAPFGKRLVETSTGVGSTLLNILWFVLAGWWLAAHHIVLAFALAVTIIGIPFAWQHLKLALASLAPVGRTVTMA